MNLSQKVDVVEELSRRGNVIIYGAGKTTEHLLNNISLTCKEKIIALADRNIEKQNAMMQGISIISPETIHKFMPKYLVISVESTLVSMEIFNKLSTKLPTSIRIVDLNGINTKQPILVYQMGKVGSVTVFYSLRHYLDQPIYHVHRLNPEYMLVAMEYRFRYAIDDRLKEYNRLEITEMLYLRNQIKMGIDHRWKIITLVRDPLERNISAFFHEIEYWNFSPDFSNGSIDVNEVLGLFLKKHEFHDMPLEWFDLEMKSVFHIDVYDSEFPKERGYHIYHGDNVDLLLIRLENLSSCGEQVISQFLNIEGFKLKNENVANNKDYGEAYKKFKKDVKLPGDYIDKIYSSKYARHFYTDEEIHMFRNKWNREIHRKDD